MDELQTVAGHAVDLKNKINKFFSGLKFRLELFHTYKQSFDKFLASDFNVFDYISPNENRLSDIIGDLLDPKGKHGQKETFLNEFLKVIGRSGKLDSEKGVLFREKSTDYLINSQRRIDITIDFGEFGIGIENEPWAIEQKDQMKEYNEQLKKKYKGSYLLIYISSLGSEPQSLSKALRDTQGRRKIKNNFISS